MKRVKKIQDRLKDKNGPCIVVAEISANHRQDIENAIELIAEAKGCGADAVKFQAYTPDTLTIDSDNRYFKVNHPKWGGQTLYELYKKAYTPWGWFRRLKKAADDLDIPFFSTAFDKDSIDMLEGLNVPFHKISSFELVDLPLIAYAARTGKPLILSTGMATICEISEAVKTARKCGARDVMLLKCVSSYPADPGDMNLRTIPDMKKRFMCRIGLSDHSLGIGASIAAVSLGAGMIEKHFTVSRKVDTVDSFFSMEPAEFKELVANIRVAERAMGRVLYGLTESERMNRAFRRSLFAVKDIEKRERITEVNVRAIRPGYGLHPRYLEGVLGRKARQAIKKGTPLRKSHIE